MLYVFEDSGTWSLSEVSLRSKKYQYHFSLTSCYDMVECSLCMCNTPLYVSSCLWNKKEHCPALQDLRHWIGLILIVDFRFYHTCNKTEAQFCQICQICHSFCDTHRWHIRGIRWPIQYMNSFGGNHSVCIGMHGAVLMWSSSMRKSAFGSKASNMEQYFRCEHSFAWKWNKILLLKELPHRHTARNLGSFFAVKLEATFVRKANFVKI